METPIINLPITSKYKEVVEAVRANQHTGMELSESVESAFTSLKYKFESDEDEAILRSWFNNSFAA